MSNERQNDARGPVREDDLLNADGQTARKITNTTGEYSVEGAREGFERAHGQAAGGGEAEAESAVRDNGP